jgi:predicted metal-binding transcription factor (methanogenesis marker protein 9)
LLDTVSGDLAGQALGQVWQTAPGHVVDHQKIAALMWSEPDVVNAPLVNVIKRFGVRVQ